MEDIDVFKQRLLEELNKLLKNNKAKGWDNEQDSADLLDEASKSSERRLLSSLSINDAQLYRQIEAALRKIKKGTYGLCEECGNPIPPRRLNILPYATYCVRCQEAIEKISFR
ncbi:TraR/DksA family transcriptional regulator [Candidatus Poribacteria bacterium]|nr:TraR/DksA family transcriptional regulator [Candidatus Poribacteria bacterium]